MFVGAPNRQRIATGLAPSTAETCQKTGPGASAGGGGPDDDANRVILDRNCVDNAATIPYYIDSRLDGLSVWGIRLMAGWLGRPLNSQGQWFMKRLVLGILACAAMVGSASAATFKVKTFDVVYGPFSGTVTSPGSFSWLTAGFHWGGNIDLTEGGIVIADIVTPFNDTYTLYTADAAVGAPCTASACIAVTNGETVSLYSTISSLNGGQGVCCDFNGVTPQITVNPVPEAPTWAMMLLGVGAMGVVLRRRRTGALLTA
jgi:hypothetical protein